MEQVKGERVLRIWSDVKTTLVYYEGVEKPITQEQFLSHRKRALDMGLLALEMCLMDGRYKKNREFKRIGFDYLKTAGVIPELEDVS